VKSTILYLNWPPTVNNYYTHTRNGVFISKKGRQYKSAVEADIREQAPDVYITDKVAITVYMFPPDRRKRDLDNYMKALQDSISKAGLWEDDSLIDQLYIYRGEVIKGGQIVVKIEESGIILPYEILPSMLG
jgi:crossover junction endodeoxyribonuclease RusA